MSHQGWIVLELELSLWYFIWSGFSIKLKYREPAQLCMRYVLQEGNCKSTGSPFTLPTRFFLAWCPCCCCYPTLDILGTGTPILVPAQDFVKSRVLEMMWGCLLGGRMLDKDLGDLGLISDCATSLFYDLGELAASR